jgi:hypothetical protein
MSNNQLAGFPAFGSRVDTSVIYYPSEQTYSYQLTEGAPPNNDAHISYTIQESDYPAVPRLVSVQLNMFAQIKCISASGNVFYRSRTNGGAYSSWSTATALTQNQYCTFKFNGSIYAVENAANNTLDYQFCTSSSSGAVLNLVWAGFVLFPYRFVMPNTLDRTILGESTATLFNNKTRSISTSPSLYSYEYDSGSPTFRSIAPSSSLVISHRLIQVTTATSILKSTDESLIDFPGYITRIAYTPIL